MTILASPWVSDTTSAISSPALIRSPYLSGDDVALYNEGRARIARHRSRNARLSALYDGKAMVQHIGKAISPEYSMIRTVVGWPGTVVDIIDERCTIDYIDCGDPGLTTLFEEIWADNEMPLESAMAQTNSRVQGVSFVLLGRSEDGATRILPTAASRMTAINDRANRRLLGAVGINTRATFSEPETSSLYTPERTVTVQRDGMRWRIIDEHPNPSGIVPVVPMITRPRLEDDAVWGRSLISPAVISATETAVRTMLAMEVAREVFIMPLRYALDVDPADLENADGTKKRAAELYWGNFLALTGLVDEDPDFPAEGERAARPQVGQLQGQSPSGLVEMMKMLSQLIAAETGIPPSQLGFITENPPSGDGMRAYENRLVLRARAENRSNGAAWSKVTRLALLNEGVDLDKLPRPRVHWENPATFAPVTASDAMSKDIASGMIPPNSDVALERTGYSREEIRRIRADRNAVQHVELIQGLAAAAAAAKADPEVAAAAATRQAEAQPAS